MESDSATLTQQAASYQPTNMDTLTDGMTGLSTEDTADFPNPMEQVDEVESVTVAAPAASPVAPSNTPNTGDSGQASPVMEVSSDGTSDDGQKEQTSTVEEGSQSMPKEKPAMVNGQKTVSGAKSNSAIPKEVRKDDKKSAGSSSKSKKREDKGGLDSILRALNSLESPEEKLAAICKRYADLHEEHRVLQSSFKTQQRTVGGLMKERDQISSEHAKAIIAKSRLESLCRELQKHNKLVKEDSIQRAKEEDEKRKDLSAKFQSTIGDIRSQMNSNNERNAKLQEENMTLAKQLKQFVEQYEVREQKVRQHRDLEQQVAEAKILKATTILKEEQERNAKEKEILLEKIITSNKKVSMLETQVRVFKERYDDFENLHTKSTETFQKYKTEMDKMGKRIKQLEKAGLAWKTKCDKTNTALIEAIDARSKSEKETTTWAQKTKRLESLCRALQEKLHEKPSEPQAEASKEGVSPTSEVPPNSPEAFSSGQASPDPNLTPSSEENPSNLPPTASPSEPQNEEEAISQAGAMAAEAEATATASSTPVPEDSSPSPQSSTAQSEASSLHVPSDS